MSGGELKTYLCRLRAPRPNFIADMSAEERSLMQAHIAFWQPHFADGTAVALGAVVEATGASWGLGIFRAPDDAALGELIAQDPVIAADKGFSYEVGVMPRGVMLGKTPA